MESTANMHQVKTTAELLIQIGVFCNDLNLAVNREVAQENRKVYAQWKMKILGTAPDFWPFASQGNYLKPVWPDVEFVREPAPGVEALDLTQAREVINK
jgi:hypothetical protein